MGAAGFGICPRTFETDFIMPSILAFRDGPSIPLRRSPHVCLSSPPPSPACFSVRVASVLPFSLPSFFPLSTPNECDHTKLIGRPTDFIPFPLFTSFDCILSFFYVSDFAAAAAAQGLPKSERGTETRALFLPISKYRRSHRKRQAHA